jgi:hypothetical protein
LHCLARHRCPCFSLFLLSLVCIWLLVSLSCPWAKGDILDSDLSDDLTLSAFGGINDDQGRGIMNTSRAWTASLFTLVSIFLELFSTSVNALASQIESPW